MKYCLLFFPEMKRIQNDVFLNACLLFSLSFCLFSEFQYDGHSCVLLSMPRLLVEYSSTWIIFGFWSAIHRQHNNYACRIIFRVINNNNNKNHNITMSIYYILGSILNTLYIWSHLILLIVWWGTKITISILQIRTSRLRRVAQLVQCLTCVAGLRTRQPDYRTRMWEILTVGWLDTTCVYQIFSPTLTTPLASCALDGAVPN